MRAIVKRLLRLEVLAAPKVDERGETLAAAIRARRNRLAEEFGATFEDWPPASFAGVRSIAEMIMRSRQHYRESTARSPALGA